ncbi:MAG TPA: phage holin family protein [Patescibacteria group bacterium]|nr:phage holin family protein [Patescibacteria group bacterium]
MKTLAKHIGVNLISLFLLTLLVPGFHILGGFTPLLIASLVLTVLFLLVKPILHVLSLPLNALTFGLFSFVINAILLWILARFVNQVVVTTFSFPRIAFAGIIIPRISIHNLFLSYIVVAAILSFFITVVKWLIRD